MYDDVPDKKEPEQAMYDDLEGIMDTTSTDPIYDAAAEPQEEEEVWHWMLSYVPIVWPKSYLVINELLQCREPGLLSSLARVRNKMVKEMILITC